MYIYLSIYIYIICTESPHSPAVKSPSMSPQRAACSRVAASTAASALRVNTTTRGGGGDSTP